MSELISFLYSEEQGCFHHDPPESDGDSRYRLLAKNVLASKCIAFVDLLYFRQNEDFEFSFHVIKGLWRLFDSFECSDDQYFKLADVFMKFRTFYNDNDLNK